MPIVSITRESADPMALRASIGGTEEIGYYLVWRANDPDEIIRMLEVVLTAAKAELPKQKRPQG